MTSTKKLNHHAAPLAPDVTDVQPIPNPDWNLPFADKLLYRNTTDDALLIKLNAAFKAVNEAATSVTTAKAELVSRSKTVGLLLVEARKLHPELKEFKAYLKQVDGGL